MLQRKRCDPFRRAAYVGGGIKMRPFRAKVICVHGRLSAVQLRSDFLRSEASFTGSAPQRYRIVSHTSESVVSTLPRASNRRDEETTGGRSVVRAPRRDNRRQKSISS